MVVSQQLLAVHPNSNILNLFDLAVSSLEVPNDLELSMDSVSTSALLLVELSAA